jgi:hypothetical protein
LREQNVVREFVSQSSIRDGERDQHYEPVKPRRRNVLAVLYRATSPLTLDRLTDEIAALEGATESGPLSTRARESIQISLHHHHLPKLEQAGVLEYDPERHVVTDWRRLMPVGSWRLDG